MHSSALWSLSHGIDAADTARAHEAIKTEPALWDQLAFSGLLDAGDTIHEQRTCPACASSLYRAADAARIDRLLSEVGRVLSASLVAVESVRRRPVRPVIAVSNERPSFDDETRSCAVAFERTTRVPMGAYR